MRSGWPIGICRATQRGPNRKTLNPSERHKTDCGELDPAACLTHSVCWNTSRPRKLHPNSACLDLWHLGAGGANSAHARRITGRQPYWKASFVTCFHGYCATSRHVQRLPPKLPYYRSAVKSPEPAPQRSIHPHVPHSPNNIISPTSMLSLISTWVLGAEMTRFAGSAHGFPPSEC